MKCKPPVNLIIAVIATAAIAGGGGFYAGRTTVSGARPNFGQPGQFAGQFNGDRAAARTAGTGMAARGGMGRAEGMTRGELLQVSDGSLTVKLPDGGSRVVLIDDSVQVTSCSSGDASMLQVGQQIVASGTVGSDGSVAAQSVQIVPEWMNAAGRRPGFNQPLAAPTDDAPAKQE